MATTVGAPSDKDIILPLHSRLLMKAASILVKVLGKYSTMDVKNRVTQAGADSILVPKVAELTTILTEIAAVWDCCDLPTCHVIADNVLVVDQIPSLFCDIIFRTCKGMSVIHISDRAFIALYRETSLQCSE